MNCFYYTISKKTLKRLLRKDPVLTIPIYQREVMPEEGDRIRFSNFEEAFTVEKVSPSLDEEKLLDAHHIDELTRPYLKGFFDLSLRALHTGLEIVSLADLFDNGDYVEFSSTVGDVSFLLSKFEVELQLAEAESEGKSKLSETERETLIKETEKDTVRNLFDKIIPTIVKKKFDSTNDGQAFRIRYNPAVAYLDEYEPFAIMLYYGEHPLEEGEATEQISAAYVDWDLAMNYGLTVEDVQYIVEELFDYVMLDFEPDSAEALLKNPTIMLLASQTQFYEGLIDSYGWESTSDIGFGYEVYN